MNYFFRYSCFILILVSACSSSYSKFILTGTPYDALPENTQIQIRPDDDLSKYDQIGIAEIKNSDKRRRIEEAKRIARYYGGDVLIPDKENSESSDIEKFLVLVPIEGDITEPAAAVTEEKPAEKPEKEPVIEELPEPEPEPVIEEKPDYSKLPVVPYKILKGEFRNLTGQKFKALSYPDIMIKFPGELKNFAKTNKRLLRMHSGKQADTLYIIFDKRQTRQLSKYIKGKKRLSFVYTPLTLYRQSIPVVELVDIIE
ncbi:MAG: hypothetical protein JW864_01815 [Spirochaetes bacterium]|nr:hypothetical protein [Spirochaetota bacterium]